MSSYQEPDTTYLDGDLTILEWHRPDNTLLLKAAAPGRKPVSLIVQPYSDLALSIQERLAAVGDLAHAAPLL
jgi:hypothetical protein